MEAQNRLLHDVSHELRSPLARLHAAVGLARQQPERLAQTLDRIERESVRMDALVGELLTLSRVTAGPVPLVEPVDVVALASDTVADAGFEAGPRGCNVVFGASGPAVVLGRADLLHRAVENVVRNAIRHAPAGTEVRVHVQVDAARRCVVVAILDAGSGVPEENLEAILPSCAAATAATVTVLASRSRAASCSGTKGAFTRPTYRVAVCAWKSRFRSRTRPVGAPTPPARAAGSAFV